LKLKTKDKKLWEKSLFWKAQIKTFQPPDAAIEGSEAIASRAYFLIL